MVIGAVRVSWFELFPIATPFSQTFSTLVAAFQGGQGLLRRLHHDMNDFHENMSPAVETTKQLGGHIK
jgi:hypothetical protein